MRLIGYLDLPPHAATGGFDHAAIHRGRNLLYVAHTANHAVDVIDLGAERFVRSVPGLTGVAGALVHEEHDLVFTSNRGEDTVGMFRPDAEHAVCKVAVGVRPNGLAYDPGRRLLLAANVGDPQRPGSYTVTLVDVERGAVHGSVAVPGRTRWTVFDPSRDRFLVNIMDPAVIVVVDPRARAIAGTFAIPDLGPHGLDLDAPRGRLYCACDGGALVCLDSATGAVRQTLPLSGAPDVIFLDRSRERLYVAIGDPGVIDVIDVARWSRVETVATEAGAHTIALDDTRHRIHAFLPATHRDMVFEDGD